MQRTTGRDLEDLETIYREHHRRVRWVLRARGVRGDALEDLTQDTFLAVHRRLGRRDPDLPMATFVSGIARNVAFSHRRSQGRRQRASRHLPAPEPERGPDHVVEEKQAWQALESFLDELQPDQREVFVLTEIMGMRMPEVGTLIDAPRNTLYSRLKLARRRFQQRFGDDRDPRLRRAARGERPSARERRQTWLLIAGQLGGGAAPAPSASSAASTGTGVYVAAGVVLAAGIALVVSARSQSQATRSPLEARVAAAERPVGDPPPDPAPAPAPVEAMPAPSPESPTVAPSSVASPSMKSRPSRGSSRRAAPEPSPVPEASEDSVAAIVEALRRAKVHLREGRPQQALAIVEAPEVAGVTSLGRERARLLRDAACAAGDRAKARRARDMLARLGAADGGAPACPEGKSPPS